MLEIRDLKVAYGKVETLHGISLDVGDNQIVSIIGANGAGKSTLLNTISGIVKPKSGSIIFQRKPISPKPHDIVRAGIVQIPEGRRIFPTLTVEENLIMGAFVVADRKIINKNLEKVYNLFPILSERRSQFGGTLSGGEQQMLAIGRGLMSEPKLLLLDEPSLGLAPIIVRDLFNLIQEINAQGITVLLVEQNARQALAIADASYILETGRVTMQGEGGELLENPAVKKAYLGV
jgi:branched-chain amino acid transport system ATP-binding protein